MEIACFNCHKIVKRSPAHIKGRVFCSVDCRKLFHGETVLCEGCGQSFIRKAENRFARYCSFECFKRSRWKEVACAVCGKVFSKRTCEIAKTERTGGVHACSRGCRNSYTSRLLGGPGEWTVGGKYGPARKRGREWRVVRLLALERDGRACQQCGSERDLHVHHWEPYWISFDNSLENLVTLCQGCHKAKHEEYIREGFYEDLFD